MLPPPVTWLLVKVQETMVAAQVQEGAAKGIVARVGRSHVVGQQAPGESQTGPDLVGDPAAVGCIGGGAITAAADGLVVQQRAAVDRQGAEVIDPASLNGHAVGDGQARQRHVGAAGDVENPAGPPPLTVS